MKVLSQKTKTQIRENGPLQHAAARSSKIRTDGSISKIDVIVDFMYSSLGFLEESPSQINNA